MEKKLYFNIDVPNFLNEIQANSSNKQAYVMRAPMQILKTKLGQIAKRAAELDDPELNILMLETKLFEIDNHNDIQKLIAEQKKKINKKFG